MTKTQEKEQLKIVIVGHVDHGKSTLVGRLFHDTDSLPEGKFEQIQAMCKKRGMQFEWSFLMDALQAERDQEITIDTSQIWFKTDKRNYVIIDAPGHKEFLKNMISGAASSEAALLLIDASEGVKEQSKRHGYLLHLLGIDQVAVVVNKMDLINYDEKKYSQIVAEYTDYLSHIGVSPKVFIPISAREGENIAIRSTNMNWYKGPTIIEALDNFEQKPELNDLPLRLPIQDVYRFDEHKRIFVGRIESGVFNVGDELIFSPSNKTSRIKSIEVFGEENLPTSASTGECIGITLEEQIFIERGEIASHHDIDAPILTNLFRARIIWLGSHPLEVGKRYKMKLTTSEYRVEIKEIEHVIDTDNLGHNQNMQVGKNTVAEVIIQVKGLAAVDEFNKNPKTGRFMLVDGFNVVGGGIISMDGFANQRVESKFKTKNLFATDDPITVEQRALFNGHLGGVLWFTGLSGAGKSTIAMELEKRLFAKGYQVYVLDGDNVRKGLCADLGFSPEERSENLRRVGEVASLFAKAGFIVITSFIAPYAEDRRRARSAYPDNFHSVYIKADLHTCETRDPKGLYKKARAGEIENFTGISDRFEEPENAEITLDNSHNTVLHNVNLLEEYVDKHFITPVKLLANSGGEGI